MHVRVSTDSPAAIAADAIVVPVFSDGKLDGAAAAWNDELGGAIADTLSSGEISGKKGEVAHLRSGGRKTSRLLVVGLGDRATFSPDVLSPYAGAAVRHLGKRGVKRVAFALPLEAQHHVRESAAFIVEGALAGTLDTTTYRTEPDAPITLDEVLLIANAGTHTFEAKALEAGIERGRILGEAVNFARTLALTPANDMTPTHLAARAEEAAKKFGLGFEALDEAAMEKKGMGSLLGVSRGSDEPARLIVLRYDGYPGSNERVAFVGKGLTFDSGGISIKPAENMHEMKYDMSGGAGVIAALTAIAQLKPKLNVIGLVPASENLPGPRAMKPGDVLRAMNGKTIEVINTDAEGRLILADALCYARELGATRIVDCATLTGAMVVSLGHAATGAISNDDAFVDHFLRVAKNTGERYWHLPIYDDYRKAVKSEVADLRNSTGRLAGSLTAAAFLENFVDKVPWIHLDIAGTAYTDDAGSHLAKGPTGVPVRALVAFAEDLAHTGISTNGATAAHGAGVSH